MFGHGLRPNYGTWITLPSRPKLQPNFEPRGENASAAILARVLYQPLFAPHPLCGAEVGRKGKEWRRAPILNASITIEPSYHCDALVTIDVGIGAYMHEASPLRTVHAAVCASQPDRLARREII